MEIHGIQHQHPLILEDLQSVYQDYEEDDDELDDNDLIAKQKFKCTCDMCGLEIDWYHRYYYKCSESSCNYSLHKFCVEMPKTLRFPAHPIHTLLLKKGSDSWSCHACLAEHQDGVCYHCSTCNYAVDLPCVTFVEQTTIHHPGHPHPLFSSTLDTSLRKCFACGKKHEGVFYHCITCFNFSIHVDCVTLPFKFLIQNLHSHMLTLSYSFSLIPDNSKCRICRMNISDELWLYKCSKCRYYVHLDCATSRGEPFMSIFSRGTLAFSFLSVCIYLEIQAYEFAISIFSGMGKAHDANFTATDYPDLLHCPLPDESYNILPHQLAIKGKNYKHFDQIRPLFSRRLGIHSGHMGLYRDSRHEHPLRLINTSSLRIPLHDPIKRIKVICDACVRPITTTPFYFREKREDDNCDFYLHDWCARLPTKLEKHPCHPQHTLALFYVTPDDDYFFTGFECSICRLRCNGSGYVCSTSGCDYRVDVNCGFIPENITHESHPNHLLSLVDPKSTIACDACDVIINGSELCYRCSWCDFYLDNRCALHLPNTIKNKYDKHPLKLSYTPIENHKSQYFCEVCEEVLNPEKWFYHCLECGQSIHSACAPLILQSEQDVNSLHVEGVYMFLNMKLGALIQFQPEPAHFLAGVKSHGPCAICRHELQSSLIFKYLNFEAGIHVSCVLEIGKLFEEAGYLNLMNEVEDSMGKAIVDKIRKSTEKLKHQMTAERVALTFYPSRVTRPVTGHWKAVD
ncbi:hypothetical protein L1987_77504 [Smallanthus sonchifolius]|uniref:Uncharacterized protein n=1 Tax=Smallanthus sonchifolius TaxID=185202 RepID=A0ACB8Z969_9ASTR|nr:hypothetical protein L1987_77504 [Smallanthus sonchifolius]